MGSTNEDGPRLNPDRNVIPGVPGLSWKSSGDCTFIGSLVAATSVTPFPCRYAATMGATGLAFRVRWFQGDPEPRWCPSSPVGEFPEEIKAARKASGWDLKLEWEGDGIERLAPEFVSSIRAGLPVLAYDEGLNVAVVHGTEDEGRTVLMHDYFHGDEAVRRKTADLKMQVIFLGEHSEPLTALDASLQGLQLALRFHQMRHDPPGERRGYWHGVTAFEKWAEDLGLHDTLTDDERASLFMVNWWNYQSLVDARSHAAPFIRKAIPLFPEAAREHLEIAAFVYEKEADLLRTTFCEGDEFTGPWTGKTIRDWSHATREGEQELLRCAAEAEGGAMIHIEAALASIGEG